MEGYQVLINNEEELKLLFEYTGLKWNSGKDWDHLYPGNEFPLYMSKGSNDRGLLCSATYDGDFGKLTTLESLKPKKPYTQTSLSLW